MRRLGISLVAAAFAAAPSWGQLSLLGVQLPRPCGQIDASLVTECSGIVQSLRYKGLFWALGDSGNLPAIVPVTIDGKLARGWSRPVLIAGAQNHDWEDIALDSKGNLIIADTGNNLGKRKQLMIHFVREPKPGEVSVKPSRSLQVHFADQKEVSPDYDCEAVFSAGGRVYFLTKQRGDGRTRLYRLESESTTKSNPLRYVDSFDIDGMVTAADASPDGKLVAVLTYSHVWAFEFDPKTGSIFRRGSRRLPMFAWQAEGLAFDGNDSLVIANEGGQLYRLALSDLR